jgi:hypothetical protein
MPWIDRGWPRQQPTSGDESASTIERGQDAIGVRRDEPDPAIGQPVPPEEPRAEGVRDDLDDLAEAMGMADRLGALARDLHQQPEDLVGAGASSPHREPRRCLSPPRLFRYEAPGVRQVASAILNGTCDLRQ